MPKLIPFGERILVKRKTVGEKAGSIYLPEEVQERATDLAVVVHVPENTFADDRILEDASTIVNSLVVKAGEGNPDALNALLKLNEFCKLKSIQVGDEIMIQKYVGTTFVETGSTEELTLVLLSDVIGLVVKNG
jgi:co-chaperonin GroES (HSP10)